MAYFVKSYLLAQLRRCYYYLKSFRLIACVNRLAKKKMNRTLAYTILSFLIIFVIYTGLNCSGDTNLDTQVKDLSSDNMAEPQVKKLADTKSCSKKFSVANMSMLFKNCAERSDVDNVNMECYLDSWFELIRFLNSMGKGFSFIGSDVVEKCNHLKALQNMTQEGYETVESMVLHEKENDLIQYKGKSTKPILSGSRTLLRLHRALIFLKIFFDKICENTSDESAKVSQMCYDAYHASPMPKYHPWLVRKAVGMAVLVLPTRKTFANQLCQTDLTHEQIYEYLRECAKHMNLLYENTEKIYQRHELMDLP